MRAIASGRDIYQLVEHALRQSPEPMACSQLMEIDTIRETALREYDTEDVQEATNKLSNLLGDLWRRGLLERTAAAPSLRGKARFAYSWAQTALPRISSRVVKERPALKITEKDNAVVIDVDNITITIKRR